MPADELPLDQMEAEICSLAGRISAATCQFLMLIAAYDRRGGWGEWGCRSMAHWLAWRCSITLRTARDQLRVAHALGELPAITELFSRGCLSYSQVRALTRVATSKTDGDLAEVARTMTAGQLERFLAGYRQVRTRERCEDDEYREARRQARLGLWHFQEDDGTRVIVIRQPPDEAHLLLAAIDKETEREFHEHRRAADVGGESERDSYPVRRARALTALVERGVSEPRDGDDPLIVLQVDPEVLSKDAEDGECHFEDGPALDPESARRLSCGSVTLTAGIDVGDQELRGSRTRRPTPALRRALAKCDPTCVFPGCDARIGIHAHHVRHWAKGGPTTLDNLARLCPHHHRQVHEGGYTMRPARQTSALQGNSSRLWGRRHRPRWVFSRPDGTVIPATWPLQPAGVALNDDVAEDACVSQWDGQGLSGYGLSVLIEGLLFSEEFTPYPPREDSG